MADFSALKTSIQNYIKQNGNEEITGNLLQQILLSMVTTLGDSAINDLVTALNAEIANRGNADTTLQGNIDNEETARGNADTELDGRITTLQGVVNGVIANIENGYVYAGIATPSSTPASGKVFYLALTAGTYTNFGATVVPQGINILKYNGTAWSLDSFLGLENEPTQGSNNLVKSGGIYNAILNAVDIEKTRASRAEAILQQSINNEKNRAINAENNLHEEVLVEKNARKQEIVGMRNDVLSLIHDYQPIVIEGNVVNAPDEEDITQEPNNLLKFKDKAYNPTIFSGLGKKYLRRNVLINEDYISFDGFVINPQAEDVLEGEPDAVLWDRIRERFVAQKDERYYLDWQGSSIYLPVDEDKIYVNENIPYFWNGEDLAVDDDVIERYGNKLTQDMLSEENTIYIIQYDYTLASNIIIPVNCVLEFDGGSISNANGDSYSLTCDNTEIRAGQNKIFGNVTINGSVKNYKIYLGWWHEGFNEENCTFGITNICALCEGNWGLMHEIVLINNKITLDPDVFVVNGVSVAGNGCIITSSRPGEGVGLKYQYNDGYSTYAVQTLNNFMIMGFETGIWAFDQVRAENICCHSNVIGCKVGRGNAYLSDFEKCVFFRNSHYGVVTEGIEFGGGIADTKFVRCWLAGNGYANLYSQGSTFIKIIECNIEDPGRNNPIGFGIICTGYPTGLQIINSYFESGSGEGHGISGVNKDIGVLVFGQRSEIDDTDVRSWLETIGVGASSAIGNNSCYVKIEGCHFQSINGAYLSTVLKTGLFLKDDVFVCPSGSENTYYGIRLNYNTGSAYSGQCNNLKCVNYTKGFAKTAFSFSSLTTSAQAKIIAQRIIIDDARLGIRNDTDAGYALMVSYNNNSHLLTNTNESPNKVFLYNVFYIIKGVSTPSYFYIGVNRENGSNMNEARYQIQNGGTLSGKYLILFARKGTTFIMYKSSGGSYVGERVYIYQDFQVIKLPDIDETRGLYFTETPYYAIALTEQEFLNSFDCYGFDVIEGFGTNEGKVSAYPVIEIFRASDKGSPLKYGIGEDGAYYTNGFRALGLKGTTRPSLSNTATDIGYQFFDENLTPPRPIWWIGTGWVDATGATV